MKNDLSRLLQLCCLTLVLTLPFYSLGQSDDSHLLQSLMEAYDVSLSSKDIATLADLLDSDFKITLPPNDQGEKEVFDKIQYISRVEDSQLPFSYQSSLNDVQQSADGVVILYISRKIFLDGEILEGISPQEKWMLKEHSDGYRVLSIEEFLDQQ